MTRHFVLMCDSSEDWDGCEVALISLDEEDVKRILTHSAFLQLMSAADNSVCQVTSTFGKAHFYGALDGRLFDFEDFLERPVLDTLLENRWVEIDDVAAKKILGAEEISTDVDKCSVLYTSVRWETYAMDSSARIETYRLPLAVLGGASANATTIDT